jgi:hypothetical protein
VENIAAVVQTAPVSSKAAEDFVSQSLLTSSPTIESFRSEDEEGEQTNCLAPYLRMSKIAQ